MEIFTAALVAKNLDTYKRRAINYRLHNKCNSQFQGQQLTKVIKSAQFKNLNNRR